MAVLFAEVVARNPGGSPSKHEQQHQQQPSVAADPAVGRVLNELMHALKFELKFHGGPQPSQSGRNAGGCVTSGQRDGSAHILRCLKVWYDLPSDVFFSGMLSVDRFLAKMKVATSRHLACISVSSFHLACVQHRRWQKDHGVPESQWISIPDAGDLVNISQAKCSPSDMARMQDILTEKLNLNLDEDREPAISMLTLLRLMYRVSAVAARQLGLADLFPSESVPNQLLQQLEILSSNSRSLAYRPAEVALSLIAADFQSMAEVHPGHSATLMGFINELQKFCNIQSCNFASCLTVVLSQLDEYHGDGTVTHRQRLTWKLSNRTLRHLRPTDKLRATLPTIMENTSGRKLHSRMRSNSECSDDSLSSSISEETDFDREAEEMDLDNGY